MRIFIVLLLAAISSSTINAQNRGCNFWDYASSVYEGPVNPGGSTSAWIFTTDFDYYGCPVTHYDLQLNANGGWSFNTSEIDLSFDLAPREYLLQQFSISAPTSAQHGLNRNIGLLVETRGGLTFTRSIDIWVN